MLTAFAIALAYAVGTASGVLDELLGRPPRA
jgi:hypothetical protein